MSRPSIATTASLRLEWRRRGEETMGGRTVRGRSRKGAKVTPAGAARKVPSGVEEYIARQLKTMYDEVIAEPVPDRLLELLNRLDSDTSKK
jgi:hypothetical protein